jgi:Tol biopolymer transport system component
VSPTLIVGADLYNLLPSPSDNRALIVAWHGGLADYYLVSEAGKQFMEVVTDVSGVPQSRFSPDGRHLAISGQIRGKEQYMLVDVSTGKQTMWETGNATTSFVFSADSRVFAFSAEVKGQSVLFAVNVDGGEPHILADNARLPIWSP